MDNKIEKIEKVKKIYLFYYILSNKKNKLLFLFSMDYFPRINDISLLDDIIDFEKIENLNENIFNIQNSNLFFRIKKRCKLFLKVIKKKDNYNFNKIIQLSKKIYKNNCELKIIKYNEKDLIVKFNNFNILFNNYILNVIFDKLVEMYNILYFTFLDNNKKVYIFYGNLNKVKYMFNNNNLNYEYKKFIDFDGVYEYFKIVENNQVKKIIEQNNIFNLYKNRIKQKIIKNISICNPKNFKIIKYTKKNNKKSNIKTKKNFFKNKDYNKKKTLKINNKFNKNNTLKISKKKIIIKSDPSNSNIILIENRKNNLFYPLDRIIHLWDDNDSTIVQNYDINSWGKRHYWYYDNKLVYKYDIGNTNNIKKLNNFLSIFGDNKKSSFIKNKIKNKKNDYKNDYKKDKKKSFFEIIGYNNTGVIVKNPKFKDLKYFLHNNFKFNPELNLWYKNNFEEDIILNLNKLGYKESIKSKSKIINYKKMNKIYKKYNDNTLFENIEFINNDLNIIEKTLEYIYKKKCVLSLYFETIFNNEIFLNFQNGYNNTVLRLWIGFENKIISININDILKNKIIKDRLIKILKSNIKYCYNLKSVLVLLSKCGFEYDINTFKHDILLASWVYNPSNFEPKNIKINRNLRKPCQDSIFDIEYIFNNFTNNYTFLNKYSQIKKYKILYLIYPLFIMPFFIEILKCLKLFKAYELELEATKLFAEMERNGLYVNKKQLLIIHNNLKKELKKNIKKIKSIKTKFKISNFLTNNLNDKEIINYLSETFYKEFAKKYLINSDFNYTMSGYNIKPGSKEFIQKFIENNMSYLKEKKNLNLNNFLNTLINILKLKYIYSKTIPELLKNINEDSEIHPCINVVAYEKGRIDAKNPRIHWFPNTSKTIWGKLIRRTIQSRKGYKFIIVDWSAQEILTLALLSKSKDFINSINLGDQHVSTGISIYKDQTIDIKSIHYDKKNITFKINGKFIDSNEKTIYISNNEVIFKFNYINKESNIITIQNNNLDFLKIIKKPNELNNFICISKIQRYIAKQVNFGIIYGKKVEAFAQDFQLNLTETKKIIKAWWKKYNSIEKFIKKQYNDAFLNGFVETYFGKRKFYPQINYYKERIGNNDIFGSLMSESIISYLNSGTAADWLKLSLVQINKELIKKNLKKNVKVVHSMHDEIVYEVKNSYTKRVSEIITKIMKYGSIQEFKKLNITVKISNDICNWWDECEEKDDKYLNNLMKSIKK